MDFLSKLSPAAQKLAERKGHKDRLLPQKQIEKGTKNIISGKCYKAGFSTADITPYDYKDKTYWMAGYNIAKKITGFLDPLTANAMWIGCENEGLLMLSLDLIGLTGTDVAEIKNMLQPFCSVTGCRHITVSCTHTHAGVDTMGYWGPLPKTGRDKKYMAFLFDTVYRIANEAYNNAKEGKLYYGNTDAPELIERWRKPYFFVPRLHRLRFVPSDGSKEIWFLNFPAHPNTLGGRNRLISADYVCYLRREINVHKSVDIMYAVGAIGAMDIGVVADDITERTVLGGMMLGEKALEITEEKELKPQITFVVQKFIMPIDNYVLSLANALKIFNTARTGCESMTGSGFVSEIDYIAFDFAEIITHPGECFQELIYPGGYKNGDDSATGYGNEINPVPLTEIMNNENLMIFGVTNDMTGYAIAPNDFVLDKNVPFMNQAIDRLGNRHYHETNSCGINTGIVVAETVALIKNILNENKGEK